MTFSIYFHANGLSFILGLQKKLLVTRPDLKPTQKIIGVSLVLEKENKMPKRNVHLIVFFMLIYIVLVSAVTANNLEVILSLEDRAEDDYGSGMIVYPTNEVFVDGLFDLLNYSVWLEDSYVVFELKFREMTNPWNGTYGFSHQFIEILLDTDRRTGSGRTDTLYGANLKIKPEEAWEYAIIATGWWSKVVKFDGTEVQDGVFVESYNETNTICIIVSQSVIGNPSGGNWLHTVLIGSEMLGSFRPVDAVASEWSFGGGFDERDDPNVIDMLKSEEFSQEAILAYSPVDHALFFRGFLGGSVLLFSLFLVGATIFFIIKTGGLNLDLRKIWNLLSKRRKIIGFIMAVWLGIFALTIRWHALKVLGDEVDEGFYIPASMHYANAMKNRNWMEIVHYDFNIEHPVFAKLVYGFSIVLTGSVNSRDDARTASRLASALFTVGTIILVSLVNPIAGFFLSVNSWSIMYSSVAYLDSPTAFFATLAVLTFNRSKYRLNKYLIISAVATGMSFASKYTFPIPIAIFLLLLWKALRERFTSNVTVPLVCYGVISVLTFFLCDPILWNNTGERLHQSFVFHPMGWKSPWVTEANLPIYYQFVWLSTSNPWHASKFVFHWDAYVLFFGLLGFPFLYRKNRIYGVWFLATALFLFFYPVKWPQYTLIFIPPLTLALGELIKSFLKTVYKRLKSASQPPPAVSTS